MALYCDIATVATQQKFPSTTSEVGYLMQVARGPEKSTKKFWPHYDWFEVLDGEVDDSGT